MAAVTICSDFGPSKNKVSHCFHCFPVCFYEVMGIDVMIFVFRMLSSKPGFSLSSFTFIKSLFWSSLLSAKRVVLSAYMRFYIFLLAILILACPSILVFRMMYSAYKLNKQSDSRQPWCTPFPIWNQFIVPCQVLTVASWPAYRYLRRQIRWSGSPISFKYFPQFVVILRSKTLGYSIKQK